MNTMSLNPFGMMATVLGAALVIIVSMWWLLKALVVDKLRSIERQIGELAHAREAHGNHLSKHGRRLTRIETAMEMHGCFGSTAYCSIEDEGE